MTADITLVNLNMLFMRYGEEVERELHVPLGPLYLTRALEDAGFAVDFRDYQCVESEEPFDMGVFLDFLADPAPVIGLSCMANLLPFTMLAMRALRRRYPDRTLVLGGVGATAVEEKVLTRAPWIDVISRGEAERTGPELLAALRRGGDLSGVRGISFRRDGRIVHTPDRERITDLDSIPFPAFQRVELKRYAGYGMMTSRGCPYPCTFCSVAPVWNLESYSRSPRNIVDEMEFLHRAAGVDLFLFQDEFFVSGKPQVMRFCDELDRRGLNVQWKAFGRVNLVDEEMMRAMAATGCVELRFGIESGSDRVLQEIKKGFTAAQSLEVVPKAIPIFPRVDAFFVWGFPFETMEDFGQSLFQMVSFRMLGRGSCPACCRCCRRRRFTASGAAGLRWSSAPISCPSSSSPATRSVAAGGSNCPSGIRNIFNSSSTIRTSFRASFTSTWRVTSCRNSICSASSVSIRCRSPAWPPRRVAAPIRRGSSRRSWPRGWHGKRAAGFIPAVGRRVCHWLCQCFPEPLGDRHWHSQWHTATICRSAAKPRG